jgi:hypothetical protein
MIDEIVKIIYSIIFKSKPEEGLKQAETCSHVLLNCLYNKVVLNYNYTAFNH